MQGKLSGAMPTASCTRLLARRAALTGRPADVVIALAGSGHAAYQRVRATFLPDGPEHSTHDLRPDLGDDDSGRGAVVEAQAFGGSVIEGYHRTMTVVLDDAVVEARDDGQHPDAPTTVRIWCADPTLRAALAACVREDEQVP